MANEQIPLLEFSRGSAGTSLDGKGELHEWNKNELRLAHDFDGNELGYLIEENSYNLINDNIGMTSLSALNSEITGNFPDPLGRNNAHKWQCNNGTGNYEVRLEENYNTTDGTASRYMFLKAGTWTTVRMSVTHAGDSNGVRLNLETGEVTTQKVSDDQYICQPLDDGWFLLGVYRALVYSGFDVYMTDYIGKYDSAAKDDHTNDDYVYVAYPQFEEPNPYTSLILTGDGHSQQRQADIVNIVTDDWYKPGGSTFRGAHRVSSFPDEPTILATNGVRIYQNSDGFPVLDGPGQLITDAASTLKSGDLINWRWLLDAPNVDKYTLGRDYDDSKWLNGYIYSLSYEANRITTQQAWQEIKSKTNRQFDDIQEILKSNGADGVYYDPSDMSTLFQDAAGTVPVTESGQPVGMMLDKSGNGHHLAAPNDSARPTLQDGSGFRWLEFDGVDDRLDGAAVPVLSTPEFVVSYAAQTDVRTAGVVASTSDNEDRLTFFVDARSNPRRLAHMDKNDSYINLPYQISLDAHIFEVQLDNGVAGGHVDDTVIEHVAVGDSANSKLYMGYQDNGSIYLSGRIYGLIILGQTTEQERLFVRKFLSKRSGVAL